MISKKNIKFFINRIYTSIYATFHPIKKKILFESFRGKQYSGNPRAISEMMHEKYPDYEIVWALNSMIDTYHLLPDYIKIVPSTGKQYYQEVATAYCHVSNEPYETNIHKRRGQFNVQTWHGDRTFKKVLYDAWEGGKRPTPVMDNKVTDICLAASIFGESVYRTAFQYQGDILTVGSPRNDKLIKRTADTIEIRKKIKIDSKYKIMLYAPTFRDQATGKQKSIDINRTLAIKEKTGEKWICLLRAHPASKGIDYSVDNKTVIDVTDYPDMADLLCITDLLITDYSSTACDAVSAGIPTILAIYDADEYTRGSRELKVTPEEAGFIIAYDQNSLEDLLCKTTEDVYRDMFKRVDRFYGTIESGNATEKVCELINDQYTKMHSV